MPPRALASLVAHLVDYAGLFPPASRAMDEVVTDHLRYRGSAERWMLGRIVAPVSGLDELSSVLAACTVQPDLGGVAAIGGADVVADVACVRAFNARGGSGVVVDVLESKAATSAEVRRAAEVVGDAATLYVEIPVAEDPASLLDAVRVAGVCAKIRTGGVTAAAFPTAAQVARFVHRCAERRVKWKATAGLHHPVRAEYPLTYAPAAPRAPMFGFLQVFAAGVFAFAGMGEEDLARLLLEHDPRAVSFDDAEMRWNSRAVSASRVAEARDVFAASFGSCSFREPVEELHALWPSLTSAE